MDNFSIEEVRDIFENDVASRLDRVERAAAEMSAAMDAVCANLGQDRPETLPLRTIENLCHTIFGTCSLVSVDSISDSARRLELLAGMAQGRLEGMAVILREVQGICSACRTGGGMMKEMLARELRNDRDGARKLNLELREMLGYLDPSASSVALPLIDSEPPPPALQGTFRLPETAAAEFRLADELPPPVPDAAEDNTGFAFGSSAVPPDSNSLDAPAVLGEEVKPVDEPQAFGFDAPPDAPLDVPPVFSFDAGGNDSVSPVESGEASTLAQTESIEGFQFEVNDPVPAVELPDAPPQTPETPEAVTETGFTFVSAPDVQAEPVSEPIFSFAPAAIQSGEAEAENDSAASTEEFKFRPSESLQPVDEGNAIDSELVDIFHTEARSALENIDQTLQSAADCPEDPASFQKLERIYHTIKGSAATVGLLSISRLAAELETWMEPFAEGTLTFPREDASALWSRTEDLLKAIGIPLKSESASDAGSPAEPAGPAESAGPAEFVEPAMTSMQEALPQVDPDVWEAFSTEAAESLDSADQQIVALEESETPQAQISELFRVYHTLKGAFYTVGLTPVGKVVHAVENLLESLQTAPILPPVRRLASVLLRVQEALRRCLTEGSMKSMIAELQALEEEILHFGECRPEARLEQVPAELIPKELSSSIFARDRGSTRMMRGDVSERRFIRVAAERLDGLLNLAGELVVSRSRMSRRTLTLRSLQRELMVSRNRLLSTVDGFRDRYEFSLLENKRRLRAGNPILNPEFPAFDRAFSELELDRYDDINILARSLSEISNDVSELQIQLSSVLDSFSEDSDSFNNIVGGLRDEITRSRMVPMQQLFTRLRLAVRDAAERENKDVRVELVGEEVSIDKTIIDELYVPMQHLVRNSASHGIERPDVRLAHGKMSTGTVTLTARQDAGLIVLTVRDDGRGLDLPALRQVGIERGLISADIPVQHPSIPELIFAPGVSTRKTATEVAGRGVGCDVVRREIERLNGTIRVESTAGLGTVFTITLPLTLSISRSLLLRDGGHTFAVPTNFVHAVFDLDEARCVDVAEGRRVEHEGQYLTLVSLRDVLRLPEAPADSLRAPTGLLLQMGATRLVLQVGQILGLEETVVKPLGVLLQGHTLFSGATPSADGRLILILDIPGLLEMARNAGNHFQSARVSRDALADRMAPQRARRVLFVDDSLSVRKVAEKFLTAAGVEVTLAVDGIDGLSKLRSEVFDIVFTDLEMPRMNGYDLIREMRYVPKYKELPVVVVTSRSGTKHRERAEMVGATDYITKPFTPETILLKLREHIDVGVAMER